MTRRLTSFVAVLTLTLPFSGPASTSQAKTIVSQPAGECVLSIETNDEWGTLRLRAHHPEGRYCRIGKEEMLAVLTAAFSKTEPPKLEGTYTSLFIGRLIDFPWLSHDLVRAALNDTRWDREKRPPARGGTAQQIRLGHSLQKRCDGRARIPLLGRRL